MRLLTLFALLLCGALAGCTHQSQYEDVVRDTNDQIMPASGDGDGDGDGGDGDGDGDGDGGDGDGDGDATACLDSCPAPPATGIDVEACCVDSDICGIREVGADGCARVDLVFEEDLSCPGVTFTINGGQVEAPGCCRADGQCGAVTPGVGCLERSEIPEGIGGPFEPRPCVLDCADVNDCGGDGSGFVCAPGEGNAGLECASTCDADGDCPPGEICALRLNAETGKHEVYCQPPIGDLAPDEECAIATECTHNFCAMPASGTDSSLCTKPCSSADDCGGDQPRCAAGVIMNEDDEGTTTRFKICSRALSQ